MPSALVLDCVQHRYGTRTVLHDVSLEVHVGEFVGLVGPNGSGKTTLLKLSAGIVTPTDGTVTVAGCSMHASPTAARARLGMAIDPAQLPSALTGRQVLELVASVRGVGHVPDATLKLANRLGAMPAIDLPVARCSLGQKQKIGVLAGLIADPALCLLDEPFNGLDPLAAFELREFLAARVRTGDAAVVLSTHSISFAERCINRAVLMLDGRIVRDWDRDALNAVREPRGAGLEMAMIDAIRDQPAHDEPSRD